MAQTKLQQRSGRKGYIEGYDSRPRVSAAWMTCFLPQVCEYWSKFASTVRLLANSSHAMCGNHGTPVKDVRTCIVRYFSWTTVTNSTIHHLSSWREGGREGAGWAANWRQTKRWSSLMSQDIWEMRMSMPYPPDWRRRTLATLPRDDVTENKKGSTFRLPSSKRICSSPPTQNGKIKRN